MTVRDIGNERGLVGGVGAGKFPFTWMVEGGGIVNFTWCVCVDQRLVRNIEVRLTQIRVSLTRYKVHCNGRPGRKYDCSTWDYGRYFRVLRNIILQALRWGEKEMEYCDGEQKTTPFQKKLPYSGKMEK